MKLSNFEPKIWGRVSHIFDGMANVSLLQVNAGFRCSIHKHEHRFNHFFVVSGKIRILWYNDVADKPVHSHSRLLTKGQMVTVCPKVIHCFEVVESGSVVEVYWTEDGTPVDQGDIYRYDEGRAL